MNLSTQYLEACKIGDLKKVKEIIAFNPLLINHKSPEGWTGLIISCFNEHLKIAEFLIDNGADVNAVNHNGTSVFMYAKSPIQKKQNDTAILELLLKYGANINHLDIFDKTVLDYVKENQAFNLAKWLISKGAKLSK